jgi:hypothetical protein
MNIFIEWVCPALFMIFLYTFLIKKYYKKTEEDKTELEDQRRETVRMSNYLDTKQEDLENSLKNNIHLIKNIMIFLNQLNHLTHEIIDSEIISKQELVNQNEFLKKKITKLKSDLHNARQRSKRLAKNTVDTV